MNDRQYHFDTLAVQGGQEPDPATGALAVPIYQTTSFAFRDTEHAAALFDLADDGYIYSRISNPTVAAFERRVALLEGGVGALATGSGQAAALIAVATIAGAGDHIVSSASIYAGTFTLFSNSLRQFGMEFDFVPADDVSAYAAAIRPNTRALYVETIGNPGLDVPDFEALAHLAHDAGIPLIVDNTFASPWLCRPFEHGADIVFHSATKYIGGHGNSIGGVLVDSGKFDWGNGKFPALSEPDPGYHGMCYRERFGDAAYISRARLQFLRDLGPALSPFNAFLFLQGLETLHLRMARHCENATQIAAFLQGHPKVQWVNYPGIASHRTHANARRYLRGGFGAMLGFGVRGGVEGGKRFIESLRLVRHIANVGDAHSLAIHPASTTHSQLTPEQRLKGGISDDFIRFSVGIEAAQDIIADIDAALSRL
ncbi:MAG: O-acetylhomoserine aminocarboxypropyltransferase/cysteine synthase family protein [Anaerolineae bacterium]